MTIGLPENADTNAAPVETATPSAEPLDLPEGYNELRANSDIQYAPIDLESFEPREPSWLDRVLRDAFSWLGDFFGPLGQGLAGIWPVLQWVLLAALVGFVLFLVLRLVGPLADRRRAASLEAEQVPEWQPDREESLALLEDADRLAAEGRFDEAAHLLLQRSVGQIAAARPEWVDPSSTARELAALPRLSVAARRAFEVISEAVERSLFALKSLSLEDWEAARAAYADFALARIDAGKANTAASESVVS
jgi:hypothetical protein